MTTYGLPRTGKAASEDAFAAKAWDGVVVAALADGVGSAQGAREASARIVHSLIHHYVARPRSWSPERTLEEFTQRMNHSLHTESLSRYGASEMVSTVAAVVLEGGRLHGLNVGDSRIYRLREGKLAQLSTDHVVPGVAHAIDRAVGLAPTVQPQLLSSDLRAADLLLLCSDGVSNHLDGDALEAVLQPRPSARVVVSRARERMTPETDDDFSAVVIDVVSTESAQECSTITREIPAHLAKGEIIDGYQLQRAFQNDDRVWLAVKDGGRFILKFAPREATESEEHARLFQREIFNATRLESRSFPHAHVPAASRWNYYVMDFIDAPTLSSVLKRRPLTAEEAVALGRFLCGACQELAAIGLVHGDIKPDNVLAYKDGDALEFKLLDLGSAMEIFTIHARAGTASYLAPERFGDAPATERTEIFAIGAALYQALTGRLPYGEIERFQTPRFPAPKRAMSLNANVPPWLDAVLMRAIASAPETRYTSLSELRFDLEHPETVSPFHFRERDEHRALVLYRASFFTLLAAVILYFLIRMV